MRRMETDVKKYSTGGILKNSNGMIVIDWPSTEPSIKRCTCVNKLKNSGSRWMSDNNITICPGRFESVGQRMAAWESACRLRWPPVEQLQPRWGRNAAMVRRSWGQYSSLSPSPTHLLHTTTITLSRIKCERLFFIKKYVRSFIEVHHYCWQCFCIYLYTYTCSCMYHGYTTKRETESLFITIDNILRTQQTTI